MPPVRTVVSCPNCRNPVQVELEQLFDVTQDPDAKRRYLSGRFNLINCPTCGYRGQAASIVVYHDNDKDLLLSYVPMEIGLPPNETEKVIGRLVNEVVNKLPQERRKAYLFSPRQALTLQGMMDWVLEKDGVTRDQLDAQRAKAQLLQKLLTTTPETLPALIQENDAQIDGAMFQILAASASATTQQGGQAAVKRFSDLQQALLEHSSYGRQARERQRVTEGAMRELQDLGDRLNRDTFFELVTKAESDEKLVAYVSLARPLADYAFFEALTRRIDRAEGEEKANLTRKREMILELTREIDAVNQQRLNAAVGVLRKLIEAPDLKQALSENIEAIDDTFLALLEDQIASAERTGRPDVVAKLNQINAAITDLIRQAAPPEIQFINALVQLKSDVEAEAELKRRADEITPEVVQTLAGLAAQVRDQGQQPTLADRLEKLHGLAMGLVMERNFKK